MSLPISNIVRVTVLSALRGLSNVNTSALALITDEVPIPADYGDYRVYLEPTAVADDFGSNSDTFRLATVVFSQNPNVLTGGGYLVVIPREAAALASPAVIQSSGLVDLTQLIAEDYKINIALDGGATADIEIGEIDLTTLATAQASLNIAAITAAGLVFSLSGELTSARVTLSTIATGAAKEIEITQTLVGAGTSIAPVLKLSGSATGAAAGTETVKDCILRTVNHIPYFGIIYNEIMADAMLTQVSQLVQSLDLMQFVASDDDTDIAGIFTTLINSGFTQTRTLFYSVGTDEALDFAAGYASRGLSVPMAGTNTMLTMHLKEIVGLVPDPEFATSGGQTLYDALKGAGVDCYADFGVPGVASFGVNKYFDEVYIQLAFKLRLQVAGFNFLKQNPFKIPQTEDGVNGLKGAYRKVCKEFVTNGSFAPGAWLSSVFFGSPADHVRNIEESGYWIFSQPVALQSSVDRAARIAPLVQIACKSSGALHSSDVLVYIER